MNASFDGSPCHFQVDSGHVVLMDPLALDGLSQQLTEVGELQEAERFSKLQALGEHGLRIGVQTFSGGGGRPLRRPHATHRRLTAACSRRRPM